MRSVRLPGCAPARPDRTGAPGLGLGGRGHAALGLGLSGACGRVQVWGSAAASPRLSASSYEETSAAASSDHRAGEGGGGVCNVTGMGGGIEPPRRDHSPSPKKGSIDGAPTIQRVPPGPRRSSGTQDKTDIRWERRSQRSTKSSFASRSLQTTTTTPPKKWLAPSAGPIDGPVHGAPFPDPSPRHENDTQTSPGPPTGLPQGLGAC